MTPAVPVLVPAPIASHHQRAHSLRYGLQGGSGAALAASLGDVEAGQRSFEDEDVCRVDEAAAVDVDDQVALGQHPADDEEDVEADDLGELPALLGCSHESELVSMSRRGQSALGFS